MKKVNGNAPNINVLMFLYFVELYVFITTLAHFIITFCLQLTKICNEKIQKIFMWKVLWVQYEI